MEPKSPEKPYIKIPEAFEVIKSGVSGDEYQKQKHSTESKKEQLYNQNQPAVKQVFDIISSFNSQSEIVPYKDHDHINWDISLFVDYKDPEDKNKSYKGILGIKVKPTQESFDSYILKKYNKKCNRDKDALLGYFAHRKMIVINAESEEMVMISDFNDQLNNIATRHSHNIKQVFDTPSSFPKLK